MSNFRNEDLLISTSEYIVAYLDLLGVTTRMKSNKVLQNSNMFKLHSLYDSVKNLAKNLSIDKDNNIIIKIFSDNIIIAKKITDLSFIDICFLFTCVSFFQLCSVSKSISWLVRGGITIGDLFIDDTMVWGEALLKAYELENKTAVFPRIIIDDKIIPNISEHEQLRDYIKQDNDNLYFLNYLNHEKHINDLSLKLGFDNMKNEINREYNERIYQNFCWHMNYVNEVLEKKLPNRDKKNTLTID